MASGVHCRRRQRLKSHRKIAHLEIKAHRLAGRTRRPKSRRRGPSQLRRLLHRKKSRKKRVNSRLFWSRLASRLLRTYSPITRVQRKAPRSSFSYAASTMQSSFSPRNYRRKWQPGLSRPLSARAYSSRHARLKSAPKHSRCPVSSHTGSCSPSRWPRATLR